MHLLYEQKIQFGRLKVYKNQAKQSLVCNYCVVFQRLVSETFQTFVKHFLEPIEGIGLYYFHRRAIIETQYVFVASQDYIEILMSWLIHFM